MTDPAPPPTPTPAPDTRTDRQRLDDFKAKCNGDRLRERMVEILFLREIERCSLEPQPHDPPEVASDKLLELLKRVVKVWAVDPLRFIDDAIWVADAKGQFQCNDILDVAPKGAAPLFLEEAQRHLVRDLKRMIESRDGMPLDLVVDKSRQVAATWIVLAVFLWAWLFRPSSRFILGTYDIDLVDGGGKGSRDSGSLFGRLRFMLDCMMWSYPHLKFNQHFDKVRVAKERREGFTDIGFLATEDVSFKLTRPLWRFPMGRGRFLPLFEKCHLNTFLGRMPKGSFSRGDAYTAALLDEMGEYPTSIGPDADREAFFAARAATLHIVSVGTVPRGGGAGSWFRELCTTPAGERRIKVVLDWCHLSYYLRNGRWSCPSCGHRNALTGIALPDGGVDLRWKGERRYVCGGCRESVFVPLRAVTSDWFEAVKESVLNNPVTLAREYWHDWYSAFEDTVFPSFDETTQVVEERAHVGDWVTIQGFDPGKSEANPGAWVLLRYSPSRQKIHIAGFHQAAGWSIYKWVPFFKCWSPREMGRMPVLHDERLRSWEQYEYDESALQMLQSVSVYEPGEIYGDKYGSHDNAGVGSAYDALSRYGIDVRWRYASGDSSPEAVLVRLRDIWMPRLTVSPFVARHRPPWRNGTYPTIVDCLKGARWISTQGHVVPKREVSAKEPRYVKHAIDALRYAVRDLDDVVLTRMRADGTMEVQGGYVPECTPYGDTSLFQ